MFEIFKKMFSYKENDFHEFKPVLAEIEDRPQNPLGNFIFWTIISLIFISGLWMYFGKVDVVVTARGIVIPDGEEKIVQSLDKGVLVKLAVYEGQYVLKGENIGIIQPAEYEPKLELSALKEEETALKEELTSAKERLNVLHGELTRLKKVLDIIPKARYEEAKKEAIGLKHQINELFASIEENRIKRLQIEKQRQILTSPAEGYIGQVFIHTEGAVVNPAEKIVSVVPKNTKLKIKAKVLNRDIGFVKEGMPVSIKADAYDFQKYGMFKGYVETISPNSIKDEQFGDIFEIYIALQNRVLKVKGEGESIKIGMNTTNEINIGKRRIIEFFIYPLIKYLDEGIKVR